jgi:uncharacterized protein YcbK (DUF882 family)
LAGAGIAALVTAGSIASGSRAAPEGLRTISFYHIHTHETLTIAYKKDGKYIPEALKKINWIMRDWRKNQEIEMDPATIDLLWEMHTELGSKEPMHIICGYRSRGTNEMLRRTVGGQASQSQHITGKAIDITFPDVPLKNMRYSAMVRERGGVGYYPTSGIPFVHVDTSRVRHWPRLPRYELALLFPSGHTQYMPAEGGPITKEDVRVAQNRHPELAVQVASFLEEHARPHSSVMVASATPPRPVSAAPKPQLASATVPPQRPARQQVAALEPAPAPRLVSAPRVVDRSSRFTPGPSDVDRNQLASLIQQAAYVPEAAPAPRLVEPPKPASRPQPVTASLGGNPLQLALGAIRDVASAKSAAPEHKVAAVDPKAVQGAQQSLTDAGWGNGWVKAPAYDEEHPEELSYRPFPIEPLMTLTASPDDPVLAKLTHHDVTRTLDLIDDGGEVQPMRLRPGRQVAQVMWAQQFQGKGVSFDTLTHVSEPAAPAAAGLAGRKVALTGQ